MGGLVGIPPWVGHHPDVHKIILLRSESVSESDTSPPPVHGRKYSDVFIRDTIRMHVDGWMGVSFKRTLLDRGGGDVGLRQSQKSVFAIGRL